MTTLTKEIYMATDLPKASSGSSGFDMILKGGFPCGRTTLLHGGTGTGKTIIGIQFLLSGAQSGEPGILVSFEEKADSLRQNALSLSWDLAAFEKEGKLVIIDAMPDPKAIMTGGFDFTGLYSLLEGVIHTLRAKRIVIDAIDILLQLLNDPAKERNQVYQLHDWLSTHGMTGLLTSKLTANIPEFPFLEYLTDCVIRLMPLNVDRQRMLLVVKYRGSDFVSGPHPYTVATGGIVLNALAETDLQYVPVGEYVTTGLSALDEMMCGGYKKGSCIVIAGPSGTGKTTIASLFAAAVCNNYGRVLYINYEESVNNIIAMMKSTGLDLEPAIQNDHLKIIAKMPEAMGPECHLYHDIAALQEHNAQYLIVDAISACKRIASENAAFSYLFRLLNYCRKSGITVLLTNQISGFQQTHDIYGFGFSSFVDTIIFLDYVQIGGEVNRTLLILKSRGSGHSNQYREFLITGQGIRFMNVYCPIPKE